MEYAEKDYQDKDILYYLYIIKRMSTRQIASIFNCWNGTIRTWLNKHNIKIRTVSESMVGKYNHQHKPFSQRFKEKTDIKSVDECWSWKGYKNPAGYGETCIDGVRMNAHIASWLYHFGEILSGLCVCHKCDNPACVNPHHLFLGTKIDNINDMVRKGRQASGINSGACKLKEEDVLQIREKYQTGQYTQRLLAKLYNVSQTTILSILKRRTWKHI